VLPVALWCLVSYVPGIWHPQIRIIDPGDVDYFQPGMRADASVFESESDDIRAKHGHLPTGIPANPIYLPAPHEVVLAFVHAFSEEPARSDAPRMQESMWSSIQLIVTGFVLSSILAIPLGILSGTYTAIARLNEPFVEFFRYLPAPAFGALAVAVLGIYAGPKIAIIFIGTFFQQLLVVANTARKLDYGLLEAALTLGTKRLGLLMHVVVPGILPDLYRDQRILLGWAWTYLVVAELIGTSSGITLFITQQARYQHFDNVYAAILLIGIIGFGSDLVLARLGRRLFPWDRGTERA
jgi:NitT/TauT family transport system permease protein